MSRARRLTLTVGGQQRTVELRAYLDAGRVEVAAESANAWIKALRRVPVNDQALRDRFTYRGDSLWWFIELYLHKQGVMLDAWEVALALDALAAQEQPAHVHVDEADAVLQHLLPQAARRFGFEWHIDRSDTASAERLRADLRSRAYTWSALASRLHPRRLLAGHDWPDSAALLPRRFRRGATTGSGMGGGGTGGERPARLSGGSRGASARPGARRGSGHGGTLVFVHSAFWRRAPGAIDEGQEGYIGAILRELRRLPDAGPIRLIGVGPRTNFGARRWWHALRRRRADGQELPLTPIEDLASWRALAGSHGVWRERMAIEGAMLASPAMRGHARIGHYDIWPIVQNELRGVARLQLPWSARAMDEAAAALDACRPRLVATYAEAGGWGRALMLEARRRGIPSVGLQHGFIYRHWLNYLHAGDEMAPSSANRHDRGFPRPDMTVLYDEHAAGHLRARGHFPESGLRVTGSPALDALTAAVSQVTDEDRVRIREQLGAASGERIVLVVSKATQIGPALPALVAAVAGLDDVRIVVKPHPAETADYYERAAAGGRQVTIAPPGLDLASLLCVSRLVVTVNSTVAIDAMTLGVPALVVLLPNNLSPFVEAGVMADGSDLAGLRHTLAALTRDETRHAALVSRARAFAARHGIQADGQAAARAAAAMVELMQ